MNIIKTMRVVQYYKPYTDEVPFILNNEKWEYCWGIYPNGKKDIAVYRYGTDMVYDFNDFRVAMGIDRPDAPEKVSEVVSVVALGALAIPKVRKAIKKTVDKIKNQKKQKENMDTKSTTNEAKASVSTKKTMAKNVITKNFDETKPSSKEAKAHVIGSTDPQGVTKPQSKATTKPNDKASKGLSPDAKKHVKGSVDPQGATKSQVKPPVKENETIKNAASKHLLGMKTDNHTENMAKKPSESHPGKEKMALNTNGNATKGQYNTSKPKESKPSEETKAQKGTEPKATKQEYQVSKAPVKPNDKAVKGVSKDATNHIAGGKTEVKGKNIKESESFMKTRAGANGKVYENTEMEDEEISEDDSWMNEVVGDDWLNETETEEECEINETEDEGVNDENLNETEDEENMNGVKKDEEEDEEDVKKLNEQINRMKQILKY